MIFASNIVESVRFYLALVSLRYPFSNGCAIKNYHHKKPLNR